MAENEQTLAEKVTTVALTLAAGWIAQKAVSYAWAKATGHDAPKDLDDPEVGIISAVTFAAAAAAASVFARRFAGREAKRVVKRFVARAS
ncbi:MULTISPECIES: DUF4235 domain-containing protein [Oerskovia]|jgi:hypothetical protein|uniref:DUF4235 domain-containing protein n=3 Tax=Oerskovia TaxID=162491 RepID=A0ABR8V1D8_9CELL|nr:MULTISPECIES: DUF4235 domain-containing protein [Oerskovia]MDF2849016.1 hypothetical protein [Oerskovia sp.]MBD7951512.1 DUF4235 domain-containing protein [Oerskovia rustica]MBD7998587.1 DUF4235 domain-containing protein [Oerskovia gallyi]MBM7498910.1 hypothetical protein [Oerskovia paurometabola]QDW61391.1 DUF4235 domain-containing protein [Oerskovia sp. KBS0722]